MRCRTPFALLLVAALLQVAGEVSAQTEADRAAAQQRLAELAQRYGTSPETSQSSPTPDATSTDTATRAAAIEELPLGRGTGSVNAATGGASEPAGLEEPTGGYVLSTLAALGVVIGLVFAARWAYTRMGGTVVTRSSAVVEVLSRTSVAPKNHVLLLRVGQRVLVVGDSGGGGLRTLADLDDPEEVASVLQAVTATQQASVTRSFNAMMSRFQGDTSGNATRHDEGSDHSEVHVDRTRDALSGLASRLRSLGGSNPGGGAA